LEFANAKLTRELSVIVPGEQALVDAQSPEKTLPDPIVSRRFNLFLRGTFVVEKSTT